MQVSGLAKLEDEGRPRVRLQREKLVEPRQKRLARFRRETGNLTAQVVKRYLVADVWVNPSATWTFQSACDSRSRIAAAQQAVL